MEGCLPSVNPRGTLQWTEGRPGKGWKAPMVRIDGTSGEVHDRGRGRRAGYLAFGGVMEELRYSKVGPRHHRGHTVTEHSTAAGVTGFVTSTDALADAPIWGVKKWSTHRTLAEPC